MSELWMWRRHSQFFLLLLFLIIRVTSACFIILCWVTFTTLTPNSWFWQSYSCWFQMCMIRKDMKSVQDRLLTQMVSGCCTFDPSVWIKPKQLGLFFCLPLILCPSLCQQNSACLKACASRSVCREFMMKMTLWPVWNQFFFFPEWFFCSKRGRSRMWREVCILCFSPDGVSPTKSYRRHPQCIHHSGARCTVHLAVLFSYSGLPQDFSGFCFYSLLIFLVSVDPDLFLLFNWTCCSDIYSYLLVDKLYFLFVERRHRCKPFQCLTFSHLWYFSYKLQIYSCTLLQN